MGRADSHDVTCHRNYGGKCNCVSSRSHNVYSSAAERQIIEQRAMLANPDPIQPDKNGHVYESFASSAPRVPEETPSYAPQCENGCQYAKDVAMLEHSCSGRCMYLDHPSNLSAVLPTADAPTAEEIEQFRDFLRFKAESLRESADNQMPGFSAQQFARTAAVADWFASHLPSPIAADADRQRMDWLDNCSVPSLQDVFGYLSDGNAARSTIDKFRAARTPEGSPAAERPEGENTNG